jgi:hypothetical protein
MFCAGFDGNPDRRTDKTSKGEFEADESYFGPHRIKGKRGGGAGGKTIVF